MVLESPQNNKSGQKLYPLSSHNIHKGTKLPLQFALLVFAAHVLKISSLARRTL
jgi:hypothetical protein